MDDPVKTAAQAEMLFNRLQKRFRHLSKWARRSGTGAFRLYDRDIPEIPLVLDWYGGAVSGALYERPYEKNEDDERRWLAAMKDAAARALNIGPERIFLKERKRQRGNSQYAATGASRFFKDVEEGGFVFRTDLSGYLDTGLFLDRRKMRALIREEAAGKKVLNLFCYTAAFSVCAAAGGAAEIDSVDLSNTYLEWGLLNFKLNGFKARIVREDGGTAAAFRFIRSDALAFLSGAEKAGRAWDMIILDPPGFSNSKKMAGVLDIRRDYQKIIERCLRLLMSGGKLWFSTNIRRFHPGAADLAGVFPSVKIKDLGEKIACEDFRGKSPVCLTFQV
jgi:23S rRNA G2069 N7-methylase RlmK/C1962 C5-methylase RlmI